MGFNPILDMKLFPNQALLNCLPVINHLVINPIPHQDIIRWSAAVNVRK